MPVKLLRRILALLIVTAYLGATVLQAAPVYPASADMSSSSMSVMQFGSIFLVSVPTPDLNLFTTTTWSSVIYDNASKALRGRTIKPALGPPISLA